ncbi:hypothetical protein BU26DRAFT_536332 [Trematosphaeria pertusa]|uniref:Uncharacterized protein n=1 Tax=Trematosphaeria pertusa TaxID=390896 RepID=A0A6A6IZS3_9PLEO|nr:uncharacterized protein BU26DRAFT_536332 [Trematosphaeria pertusa]KAF2255949.1 hypothetical protein BU26DRAFT_536332 [Trematosphaeria pertusa]
MGNLCGKQSKDNFQGPGRTLSSAPTPATKASVPARATNEGSSASKPKITGPGRTARANRTATGDLAKKLEAQKKQTRNQTLQEAAHENRAQREADAATEARNYN